MKVRIANNKNIQTMEQKDIDIYEILKDEEYGTELYTSKCGRVWLSGMANDKDSEKAIWTEDEAGREHFFDKNGKIDKEGEPLLFPSREMRDWSKFFKKGDVLVSEDGSVHIIFEKFTDDTYTIFTGKHYYVKSGIAPYYERVCSNAITEVFTLEAEDAAKTYIRTIEERLDGKLNRETLEIEKPAFKTFDKVLVRLGKEFKWLPALFIRDRGESFTSRYNVLPIHSGKPADFTSCIPFEGHENIAFTDYDIENLPF